MTITKTTCRSHRISGYTIVDGVYVCRGCGKPEAEHETNAETIARRQRESIMRETYWLTTTHGKHLSDGAISTFEDAVDQAASWSILHWASGHKDWTVHIDAGGERICSVTA